MGSRVDWQLIGGVVISIALTLALLWIIR